MKKFMFTLLLGLMLTGCQAQNDQGKSKEDLAKKSTDSLTVDKPKISTMTIWENLQRKWIWIVL